MNRKAAKRNKLKTTESLIPSMMNAVGTLLHCKNCSMNANALLNTLILRRGKVDKMWVQRFQKLGLCLSYTSLLRKQLALTKKYCAPVAKLADKLLNDLKFRENTINTTRKDRAAELSLSNEVKNAVPLFNMSPEEMNTSFFDSNALNREMVLINEPLISSNCSETSSAFQFDPPVVFPKMYLLERGSTYSK